MPVVSMPNEEPWKVNRRAFRLLLSHLAAQLEDERLLYSLRQAEALDILDLESPDHGRPEEIADAILRASPVLREELSAESSDLFNASYIEALHELEALTRRAFLGPHIRFALTRADEQRLLDVVRSDGFVALPRRVTEANLAAAVQTSVPPEREATPADLGTPPDHEWTIVAGDLLGTVRARIERSGEDVPSGFRRDAEHLIGTATLPCIEWQRTWPGIVDPRPSGRLYVDPAGEYGDLQPWLGPAVAEFERLRKLIEAWTVRRGRLHVSKDLVRQFSTAS